MDDIKEIKSNLVYFHNERTIDRYCDIDKAIELIPEFALVYNEYKRAKFYLDLYIRSLENNS